MKTWNLSYSNFFKLLKALQLWCRNKIHHLLKHKFNQVVVRILISIHYKYLPLIFSSIIRRVYLQYILKRENNRIKRHEVTPVISLLQSIEIWDYLKESHKSVCRIIIIKLLKYINWNPYITFQFDLWSYNDTHHLLLWLTITTEVHISRQNEALFLVTVKKLLYKLRKVKKKKKDWLILFFFPKRGASLNLISNNPFETPQQLSSICYHGKKNEFLKAIKLWKFFPIHFKIIGEDRVRSK